MEAADILFPNSKPSPQGQPNAEQSDDERRAESLYGSGQVEKSADQSPFMRPPPVSHPDQISVETIKAAVPANVAELRASDTERALYSPQGTYADVIKIDMFDTHSGEFHLTEQAQEAILAEYREMAADMALSKDEVDLLHSRVLNQRNNPADLDEAMQRALTRVEAKYGKEGAKEALAAANKLLNRDPRTRNLINAWGLGNDPDTVMTLVEVARREQSRGRL